MSIEGLAIDHATAVHSLTEKVRTGAFKFKSHSEILVAVLWAEGRWLSTHELRSRPTPFGYLGSSADVRARELARDDCPDKLKGKVERAMGSEIGLDRRFEYFKYRDVSSPRTSQ